VDPPTVRRCVLCGSIDIVTTTEGRHVLVSCNRCRAELLVEFAPPDAPELRGAFRYYGHRVRTSQIKPNLNRALTPFPTSLHIAGFPLPLTTACATGAAESEETA
jgi:hypothetical protein